MEHIITTAITVLIVSLLMSGVFSRSKRLKKSNGNGVFLPDFFLIIGIIGMIVFGILLCAMVYSGAEILVLSLIPIVFILVSISLIMAWKNCYILYDDEGFTQSTFFGRKRHFTYDQVTGYKGGAGADFSIYVGKKKVSVDKMAINNAEFLSLVMLKCMDNGVALKKIRGKGDIFNGNIKNPGEIIAVYTILLFFMVGFTVFLGWMSLSPVTEKDCEKYEIVFNKCEQKGSDLYLYSKEKDLDEFIIFNYSNYMDDIDRIEKLCDKKEKFSVWSKHYNIEEKGEYNEICKLSYKGEKFYTFDDATIQKRKDFSAIPVLLVFSGMTLLIVLIVVFSIITGRNPKKYPRLVKLFFRKEYIDYED